MVGVAVAIVVFAALLASGATAFAAGDLPSDMTVAEQLAVLEMLGESPVFEAGCHVCHGSLVQKDEDRISEIIFSHGYHRGQFDCGACHSEFPHSPAGIRRPTMDGCFACHGLRHGPVGIVATDKCEDCHKTRRDRLRPDFHTSDWAGKPHVQPSLEDLQTKCMMCHDGAFCDDCHKAEYVRWKPEVPYIYDPKDGCQSCHAQASMVRIGPGGTVASFQVTDLEGSAHSDLSCVQCHVDFKYEEGPDPTPIWNVNAGIACQNCHDHSEQATAYETSIHWTELQAGNYDSATCASCHRGHKIQRLDTDAAKTALHASALEVCARCHLDYYDAYNDYYHGAAYKRGTPDAPACWDCHGAHTVLPSTDPSSSVSAVNTPATCGREGCHRDTSEGFVEAAKGLIHTKDEKASTNPVLQFFADLFGGEA